MPDLIGLSNLPVSTLGDFALRGHPRRCFGTLARIDPDLVHPHTRPTVAAIDMIVSCAKWHDEADTGWVSTSVHRFKRIGTALESMCTSIFACRKDA